MKEKILKIVNSKVLFAVIFNAAVMMLCIAITSFSFENANDYYNSILICQKHFYYNSQINYILAILIGTAQYVFSDFNCFVLVQILLSCASFTAITFVFADKFNKKKAFVFSALVNIFFALNHYQSINGNKTAALLYLGGFMLVLNAIHNKRYYLSCWVGVLLIVFGAFFNFSYFFVALGFAAAFFLGDMISKKKFKLPFRKFFWYFRPFLLMFLLVTVVVFALNSFSYSINHATEEAESFYEYASLEASIKSREFPSYEDYSNEFAEVGITNESEYELLKNGYFDADTALDYEALQKVCEIQKSYEDNNILSATATTLSEALKHFADFDCTAIIMLAFTGFGIVFVIFQKNRFGFFPVFYLVTGFIANVVLNYLYPNNSLNYGIWLFMTTLLFYSLDFEKSRTKSVPQVLKIKYGNLIISCIVVACLTVGYYVDYSRSMTIPSEVDAPHGLISEIERKPHKYYVFDTQTYDEFIKCTENYIHPLWGFREGYLENVDNFGYYHNTQTLLKRNLPTNIYEAVLTHNNVCVVDKNDISDKEKYLTENYSAENQTAEYQQLNDYEDYKVYQAVLN